MEGIYRLFMSGDHNPTNIGNPDEYTVQQLAELVVELTGHEVADRVRAAAEGRSEGPAAGHHAGARRMLGWEPKVHVRDGLARTIEYFTSKIGSPLMTPRTPRPRPAQAAAG